MTPGYKKEDAIKAEADYLYAERCAILADGGPITPAHQSIAEQQRQDYLRQTSFIKHVRVEPKFKPKKVAW